MIPGAVSRRYATAILEIGNETGTLDALVGEISRAAEAYASSDELKGALENPLVPYEAKKAILVELSDRLGLSPVAKNTILFLGDRRRMRALPAIALRVRELADQKKGLLRAEVISAGPLSEDYYAKLRTELERMTGKQVAIDKREDPSLLAGVVTRIGDTVIDGSLKSRVVQLKSQLLN